MKNTKHYLASANTGLGFIDNFEHILDKDKDGFTYILKGGSGTGKSTLLKNIGKYYEDKGEEVEYFHCSSDFSSLDGVKIKRCNVSIIDGTAPHTKDPKLPGITDKIINLGYYINDNVSIYKNEVTKLVTEKQKLYSVAYKYLEVIKKLSEITLNIYKEEFSETEYKTKYQGIISSLEIKKLNTPSFNRNLFLEYIDDTKINNTINLNNYSKKLELDTNKFLSIKLLTNLQKELIDNGYSIVTFYDIITNNICGIYIQENDTLIYVNLNNYDKELLENETINFNNIICNSLISKVATILSRARESHKNIEKYYIANMNFSNFGDILQKLLNSIDSKLN